MGIECWVRNWCNYVRNNAIVGIYGRDVTAQQVWQPLWSKYADGEEDAADSDLKSPPQRVPMVIKMKSRMAVTMSRSRRMVKEGMVVSRKVNN